MNFVQPLGICLTEQGAFQLEFLGGGDYITGVIATGYLWIAQRLGARSGGTRLRFAFLLCIAILLAVGCGDYPEYLSSRRDIYFTSASHKILDIGDLPIEDYPLLVKFKRVVNIRLPSREGHFATDDKLRVLATLGLTNLASITLENARLITDVGIRALSPIQSLKVIGVEGSAITDAACGAMASERHLTCVSVMKCNGVTLKGLQTLAISDNLTELNFSTDNLTQKEVLDLLASFKNIKWCGIDDPQRKLDANAIKAKGTERGMYFSVYTNQGTSRQSGTKQGDQ